MPEHIVFLTGKLAESNLRGELADLAANEFTYDVVRLPINVAGLMTADFIDGKEAERIGLVSLCVPSDQLMDKAMEVAQKLARGPQQAVRFTKRALNNWLRMFGPAFDASLALEMMGFFSDDLHEGVTALKERRAPSFPSTRG